MARNSYFALDDSRNISFITVDDGTVTRSSCIPIGQPPQQWVDALREMEEYMYLGNDSRGASTQSIVRNDVTTPSSANGAGPTSTVEDDLLQLFQNSGYCPIPQNQQMITPPASTRASFSVVEELFGDETTYPSPAARALTEPGRSNMLASTEGLFMSSANGFNAPGSGSGSRNVSGFASASASAYASASSSASASTSPSEGDNMAARARREQKLSNMIEKLQNSPMPSKEEHNRQIAAISRGPQVPFGDCSSQLSAMQFAAALGRLSSASTTAGTVYGLLSWRLFGNEEERLVNETGMSRNLAAKKMNQRMCDAFQRRGKARDWASDGRKAAKMVFGALQALGTIEQSFALVLVGELCSLDYLLKIAHFPILRETFQVRFAQVAVLRAEEWKFLHAAGYHVFPSGPMLQRGGSMAVPTPTGAPMPTPTPTTWYDTPFHMSGEYMGEPGIRAAS